jgi:hypothetical protein
MLMTRPSQQHAVVEVPPEERNTPTEGEHETVHIPLSRTAGQVASLRTILAAAAALLLIGVGADAFLARWQMRGLVDSAVAEAVEQKDAALRKDVESMKLVATDHELRVRALEALGQRVDGKLDVILSRLPEDAPRRRPNR